MGFSHGARSVGSTENLFGSTSSSSIWVSLCARPVLTKKKKGNVRFRSLQWFDQ